MSRPLRRFYTVSALILAAAALITISLLQPVLSTRADFSVFNTRWNGASELGAQVYRSDAYIPGFSVSLGEEGVTIAQTSFADFELDPRTTGLIVLGPATPPTEEEAAWLRTFVAGGGRLFVADDFGAGNEFLEAAGASSRFDGGILLDLAYARRPEFAVSADFEPHAVTDGVEEVVLDRATFLHLAPSAVTLGRTSASWHDADGDRLPDAEEEQGPFTWLAVEPVGEGSVLLASDPSAFINSMRRLGDNQPLADGLVAWLTEGGRSVLVDESHHDYQGALRIAGATLRSLSPTMRLLIAVSVAALFGALAMGLARRREDRARRAGILARLFPQPAPPPHDLVREVLDRHPDWDENALRRILSAGKEP